MAQYQYKALHQGQRKSGVLEAVSVQAASAQLRSQGHAILEIAPARGGDTAATAVSLSPWQQRLAWLLIPKGQLEISLKQLASVLHAGVPILTALEAVGRQAPTLLKRVYAGIAAKVRRGYSLQRSLHEEAPFMGRVSIGLIAVGEANGTLDEMLDYAADLMERARKVKAQIVQAFTYPSIVVVGAMGVAYYMVSQVFPKIMKFIQSQGRKVPLPWPTRVLIQVNDFMTAYGVYLLLAPLALAVIFVLARRTRALAERIDRGILYIPLLGKAFRDYGNTLWCRTLGALLGSGVDVLNALDLVQQTLGNQFYATQLRRMRDIVRQGGSLTKGLQTTDLHRVCPMALTMVSVSETAGGLDESLIHVARYSEEQLTRRVTLLSKLVEPAIFIVVGGMVGFIYFAFFMAMMATTRAAH